MSHTRELASHNCAMNVLYALCFIFHLVIFFNWHLHYNFLGQGLISIYMDFFVFYHWGDSLFGRSAELRVCICQVSLVSSRVGYVPLRNTERCAGRRTCLSDFILCHQGRKVDTIEPLEVWGSLLCYHDWGQPE